MTVALRFAAKSTTWFYLPLLYIVGNPKRLNDPKEMIIWIRSQPAKLHEKFRFWMGAFTLFIATIASIDSQALHSVLAASNIGETPISIFSLFLVLDMNSLYPWQLITLPNALLTIVIFLWLDSLRREADAGRISFGSSPLVLIKLIRVRNLMVTVWLAIAMIYAIRYTYFSCRTPEWLNKLIAYVSEPPACF